MALCAPGWRRRIWSPCPLLCLKRNAAKLGCFQCWSGHDADQRTATCALTGVVGRAGAPEPVEVKLGLLVSHTGLCAKQKESALASLILRTVSVRAWGGVRPVPRMAAYDLSWRLRTFIGPGRCVKHAFDVCYSARRRQR